ncbi:MAG: hypothetical protein EA380_03545 [Phycisphaeraceae bacterium]|nr:MAG: hypothetical protein EA380_03545 [Phycisphaeraceae bacterium]
MSVANDAGGTRRVLVKGADGQRRTIRLGRGSLEVARQIDERVQALSVAVLTGTPTPHRVTEWLAALSDEYHGRVARTGLVAPRVKRETRTMAGLLEAFTEHLEANNGGRTYTHHARVKRTMLAMFGADTDPDTITPLDAERWRASLVASKYATPTVSKDVKTARQVFKYALKMDYTTNPRNPFADVTAGTMSNPDRAHFVKRETIAKAIEAAPNTHWRLLVSLARYGGLRIPSEIAAMEWGDIDFEGARLWIRSPKNKNHGDGGRWVPMFPELRTPLLDAFELAEDGEVLVFGGQRWSDSSNLRTQFKRILKWAGVTPWPRLFHNLRASRQTELAAEYPLATACAWIGNSRAVASGHYLQVTDADWMKATGQGVTECGARVSQNAAHRTATHDNAEQRKGAQPTRTPCLTVPGGAGRSCAEGAEVTPRGFEPRFPG